MREGDVNCKLHFYAVEGRFDPFFRPASVILTLRTVAAERKTGSTARADGDLISPAEVRISDIGVARHIELICPGCKREKTRLFRREHPLVFTLDEDPDPECETFRKSEPDTRLRDFLAVIRASRQ
jgi:hypothetical protein